METWISLAGLGLGVGGALILALGDAMLSRSILIYLDAVEANVAKLVEAVRAGDTQLMVTGTDLKRDRGQNTARALKMLGWLTLALGFALQLVARYWAKSSPV
jgi:hypothetical protein